MRLWPRRSPAAASEPSVQALSTRVALTTTAIVAVAYALIAVAVAAIVWTAQQAAVDGDLSRALQGAHRIQPPGGGEQPLPFQVPDRRPGDLPFYTWTVSPDGTINSDRASGVELPAAYAGVTGAQTASFGGTQWRIAGTDRVEPTGTVHVIVAESLTNVTNTETAIVAAEIGIGAALLLVVFFGALAIGRRVAQPIEDARQRQLEFTADASHELRTPLSVIEAQTTLALARERPVEWYRTAFGRVEGESKRMHRLVDDMLWLARFDATHGQPHAEPIDVNILAGATVDRFRAVAEARHLALAVQGQDGQIVSVPSDWLDRLLGVLLDNACKYSPEGGAVLVSVTGDARRVRLTVDDSGPGIPEEERGRIFDRFHRATDKASGAGLGLAIGDAIVRATGGKWSIGSSAAGGASISVTWPRAMSGGREHPAPEDTRVDAQA